MKTNPLLAIILSIVLVSCGPTPTPTTNVLPTRTPVPTASRLPTATPRPSATLTVAANLYSGPGIAGFKTLAQLPSGSQVFPTGIYVDFVKVDASISGTEQEGYIQKNALEKLPASFPKLTSQQVPWQPVDVMSNFLNNATSLEGDQVTFGNTSGNYVDLEGPGMPLDSSFRFTAKMAPQGTDYGIVKLLGIPEATSGKWWQGINRLDVGIQAGKLTLGIRDGTTEGYTKTIPLDIPSDQAFTFVSNDPQGKSITILDKDGKEVQTIDVTSLPDVHLPDGLFAKKVLYLGLSSAPHSTLVVSSILFEKAPSGKAQPETQTLPGLRGLAQQNGITTGSEFVLNIMSDPRALSIMNQDFDVAAISEFSSTSVWKGRGEYDFSSIDAVVNSALQNGFKIRASHLIFGATENSTYGIPEWLKNSNYSRQEYIQILQEYITAIVSRYKGKVTEWSIANEAFSRLPWQGTDFWMSKIGPDYIEIAFRAAREADPNGVLILNDDYNESPRDATTSFVVNKMLDTVKTLKAKGVPIDVVGMQMHLLGKYSPIPPKETDVLATMQKFGDLGVKIYITEFDVDVSKVPGTQAQKWAYEATVYHDMLQACLESKVCTSFTTWGISDATSALTNKCNGCLNLPDADPLMFDRDYNPKPAYFAVQDLLQPGSSTLPTASPTP
jgi:endo-1,4-beta-xylanase